MSDTHNPYAAPTSAVEPTYFPDIDGDSPPAPWAMGEVLSQALDIFKQHWAPLLGSLIVGYALVAGVQIVFGAMAGTLGGRSVSVEAAVGTSVVSGLLSMAVQAAVTCGWNRVFLMAARGEAPEFGALFSSIGLFPQMLGATLLMMLGYVLGLVLLVVPGVIFFFGTMFYSYFVADGDGAVDSLRKSWQATRGHKWSLFLFMFALGGLNILGMLACGVGVLVSAPVTMLALAIVYTRITGRFESRI